MSDDNKTVATPEEVTAKVIEDFGFDSETQGDVIEKITNERIENQKNLSKTIEQKVSYRTKAVDAGILDPTTFEPIDKKPEGEGKENLKNNTEQSGPTMEHMALFGQGATLEEVQIAETVAKIEDKTLTEAYGSDYCQNKFAELKQEATKKGNSLGASRGTPPATRAKTVDNMSKGEHRAFGEDKLKEAFGG